MNHNDTFLRDVLLSGLEPSDELRGRFEQQVEQIVRRRLTPAGGDRCMKTSCKPGLRRRMCERVRAGRLGTVIVVERP